jgi:hypothetical protein
MTPCSRNFSERHKLRTDFAAAVPGSILLASLDNTRRGRHGFLVSTSPSSSSEKTLTIFENRRSGWHASALKTYRRTSKTALPAGLRAATSSITFRKSQCRSSRSCCDRRRIALRYWMSASRSLSRRYGEFNPQLWGRTAELPHGKLLVVHGKGGYRSSIATEYPEACRRSRHCQPYRRVRRLEGREPDSMKYYCQ